MREDHAQNVNFHNPGWRAEDPSSSACTNPECSLGNTTNGILWHSPGALWHCFYSFFFYECCVPFRATVLIGPSSEGEHVHKAFELGRNLPWHQILQIGFQWISRSKASLRTRICVPVVIQTYERSWYIIAVCAIMGNTRYSFRGKQTHLIANFHSFLPSPSSKSWSSLLWACWLVCCLCSRWGRPFRRCFWVWGIFRDDWNLWHDYEVCHWNWVSIYFFVMLSKSIFALMMCSSTSWESYLLTGVDGRPWQPLISPPSRPSSSLIPHILMILPLLTSSATQRIHGVQLSQGTQCW